MYFTTSTYVIVILILYNISYAYSLPDVDRKDEDRVLFQSRDGFIPPGYEEVSTKAPDAFGAIEKCGQGSSEGVDMCVPYYRCDGETKMIIIDRSPEENTDGHGIIDIRFGEDKPCDHYLDTCCGIPKTGIPSSTTDSESPLVLPEDPKPEDPPPEEPKPKPQFAWLCGIRNDNGVDFKITGNKNRESEYGEFPWMVAIIKANYKPSDDSLLVCGGSLIAPNVVLTAAHCVFKFKPKELKIRVGEWDTQTDKERLHYQERDIREFVIHEDFSQQALFNDVALLILETPVEEAENVGTICLPEVGQVFNSKNCIATGWGKDKFGTKGVYQAILKKIELPTVPKDECQQRLRKTRLTKFFILDKSFMCAGGVKGEDTCTGDGGSPLVCPNPDLPHQYVQAGIVAWGIGCGEPIPAVYADVGQFKSWIDNKLSSFSGR